jgi:hypothetical protein
VPAIAFLFLFYTALQHVKGRNTVAELLFWVLFWTFTSLLAIFPDAITDRLAKWLGIKSNINAILFLGLGILFFIQFRLFFLLKKQNHTITELARKIALQNKDTNQEP